MIIAIDTGGTKTLIASFDDGGNKQIVAKFPTPRETKEYLEAVSSAIHEFTEPDAIQAISVAMPGPIRNQKLLRSPNIGWTDFDVINDLGKYFPGTLVILHNDAELAGLAEAREFGETSGLSMYLTFSTGVGSGIAYNGRLLPQLERFEAGSMRVDFDDQVQRWENIASGKSFYERYGLYGKDVTDPTVWQDYAERIAVGLQLLIPFLEPNHLVIGGSMGTHFPKYADQLTAILNERIAKHMAVTTLSQAVHPEEAVIYGCHYYALDNLSSQQT